MTGDGTIELQQPLGQADVASGTSDVAKEEFSHHRGNENDQADMARLGKKQRLDVSGHRFDFTVSTANRSL
jgi:hypothetical protein